MTDPGKILTEIVFKLKLDLSEQILEKLYEDRGLAEYVTLTEAFDDVTFEILYEKVTILQQSRLIEFYTAPEAYAVFREPDFIMAKIREEGIQYWNDHCSFLRKHKTPVSIALGVLALIVCSYLVFLTVNKDRNVASGNSIFQQFISGSSSDSTGMKSHSPAATPPGKSPLTIVEDRAKPKKVINEAMTGSVHELVGETGQSRKDAKEGGIKSGRTVEQNVPVDLKNNYTIEFDTVNHLVKVSPRVGKWDSTVLAIPLSEMEFVQPKFRSQSEELDGAGFAFDALGLRFSGAISKSSPKSEGAYFTLHYENKPTIFLFGSYPNSLYPYYFRQVVSRQ